MKKQTQAVYCEGCDVLLYERPLPEGEPKIISRGHCHKCQDVLRKEQSPWRATGNLNRPEVAERYLTTGCPDNGILKTKNDIAE